MGHISGVGFMSGAILQKGFCSGNHPRNVDGLEAIRATAFCRSYHRHTANGPRRGWKRNGDQFEGRSASSLDYLAHAGQSALVGISTNVANHTVEYWLSMTIDPIADMPLDTYLLQLQIQWQEWLRVMSPCISQCFADQEIKYAFRMRYQANVVRAWFAKEELDRAGIPPLAEAAVPRDKLVSRDAESMTYPPMPDEFVGNSAELLFSGGSLRSRVPNPEIAGGYIALIEQNNNQMQDPPLALDRMHACLQRQVAFNRRASKNEEEIGGINSGLADFLQDMRIRFMSVSTLMTE
jgi:hypothetical protein